MRPGSAFGFLILSAMAGPAMAQQVVGYVASIDGDASQTRLLRGKDEARPVRLAEYVMTGDVIVSPRSIALRVNTRSGPIDPCAASQGAECRYTFTSSSARVPISEWGERAAAMLSWYGSQPRNLVVRSGDPPRARFGGGSTQKLVGGKRSLWIAWASGSPPFRVSVVAGSRTLAALETSERTLLLPAVDLPKGPIEIRIADSKNVSHVISASAGETRPGIPIDPERTIDAAHGRLLAATWLATQDGGSWALEAAQIPDGSDAAGSLLRTALAAGQRP